MQFKNHSLNQEGEKKAWDVNLWIYKHIIPDDNNNIELPDRVGENVEDFRRSVNEEIEKKVNTRSKSVRFLPENNGSAGHIEISDEFGIII